MRVTSRSSEGLVTDYGALLANGDLCMCGALAVHGWLGEGCGFLAFTAR